MTLQSLIGTITTVLSFAAFLGVLWWALGRGGDSGADRSLLAALMLPGEDNRDHSVGQRIEAGRAHMSAISASKRLSGINHSSATAT